jgi:hypothetical protein
MQVCRYAADQQISAKLPTGVADKMSPDEVGQTTRTVWRRASFCASNECVEVAQRGDMIILRDSAQPHSSVLRCTPEDWGSFMRNIKSCEFGSLGS